MTKREYVQDVCYKMKEGQSLKFCGRFFNEAFPCGFPSIYNTHEQAFLSSMIGSSWGAWRVFRDPMSGDVTISRHPVSNERYYVDPDREYLFEKMPDGTLKPRF